MKGLTLLEILIVVAIIAILIFFAMPLGLDLYRSQQLQIYSQEIAQTLRMAQLKAASVELDSSFGVYFSGNRYTLFKGDSYLNRDSQFDEIFDLPQVLTLSGLSEIVFLKLEGIPKENSAYCGSQCLDCDSLMERDCRRQDGCRWKGRDRICVGLCLPCNNFSKKNKCEDQLGCLWYPPGRGGEIILNSESDTRRIYINEIGRINLE